MPRSNTNQPELVVFSRASKATSSNKYWLNVKNPDTQEMKSLNFEIV